MQIKNATLISILVSSFFVLILHTSCLKSKKPGIPLKVVNVLNIVGENKPNLTKYILYSTEKGDSLQEKSCYFILENIHRNYTSFYNLYDSSGNKYVFEPKKYENLKAILTQIELIQKKNGTLFYKADSFSIDYKNLNFEFLYKNQKLALKTLDTIFVKNSNNFNIFLNYILPYRVSNEIVEPFRQKFNALLEDKLKNLQTIEEKAKVINNEINSLVKYDERYIKSLERKTIDDIFNEGASNLENINILKVKALRSFGIPATVDYCPVLSDTNGSYFWTCVIKPDGNKILLDIENGAINDVIKHKSSKIYRRTYSIDTSSLYFIKKVEESTPPYLGHYNYLDVSREYGNNHNYTSKIKLTDKYVYLAVYNDNKWRAVDWALNEGGKVNFENLAENIVYLPVVWTNSKTRAISSPFCFINGNKHEFEASDVIKKISVYYNYPQGKLSDVKDYKIFYWNNKWIEVNSTLRNGVLNFKAPINTLYLIKDNDVEHKHRIFSVEKGKQIFY